MNNNKNQYVVINNQNIIVESDELYLSNRGIKDISEIHGLNNLSHIKKLYLNNNKITKIHKLDHLVNLEHLELSMNNIEEIEGLDSLVKLKSLHLSQNKISCIAGFDSLVNLKTLFLSYNNIEKIEGLNNLVNLENLILFANKIIEIENINHLKNLKDLKLDMNKISKIKGLENLRNLEILGLSSNQISKIEHINNLINLNRLDLSKNYIKLIEGLKFNTKLKTLFLYMNFISKIQGLEQLTELEELSLFDNQIQEITNLSSLKMLKKLELMNNIISSMNGIEKLENLEELNLTGNQISEIKCLLKLTNLKYLWLADNLIIKLEGLSTLRNLENLNLDFNKITRIEGLNNLTKLNWLNLNNNFIEKIEGILNLRKLVRLHLKNNKIRNIEGLPNYFVLNDIDLRNNKIEASENFINLYYLNIKLLEIDLYRIKISNTDDIKILLHFLDKMINQYLYFYNSWNRNDRSNNDIRKEKLDEILSTYNMKFALLVDGEEKEKSREEFMKYIKERIDLESEGSKERYLYEGLRKLVLSIAESNFSNKITSINGAKENFEEIRNKKILNRFEYVQRLILLIKSAISNQNNEIFNNVYDLIYFSNEINNIEISDINGDHISNLDFINPIISRLISYIIEQNRTYYFTLQNPERFEELIKDKNPRVKNLLRTLEMEDIYIDIGEDILELSTLKLFFAQIELRVGYYDQRTGKFYDDEISQIMTQIQHQLQKAIEKRSNFIIFPEYTFPKRIIKDLIEFSKEHKVWIIGGCERGESEEFQYESSENVVFIISPNNPPEIQKKIFRGKIEPPLTSGKKIKILHSKYGTFAILICADFLEDYLLLLLKEKVDFLIVPSFNNDVKTFHIKAKSKCLDNCCFIFINNTIRYPDSSIFAPYRRRENQIDMQKFYFFEKNLTEFSQHRKRLKYSEKFKFPFSKTLYTINPFLDKF